MWSTHLPLCLLEKEKNSFNTAQSGPTDTAAMEMSMACQSGLVSQFVGARRREHYIPNRKIDCSTAQAQRKQ